MKAPACGTETIPTGIVSETFGGAKQNKQGRRQPVLHICKINIRREG